MQVKVVWHSRVLKGTYNRGINFMKALAHSKVFPTVVISRCCHSCSCWSSQLASTASSTNLIQENIFPLWFFGTKLALKKVNNRDALQLNRNMVRGSVTSNNNVSTSFSNIKEALGVYKNENLGTSWSVFNLFLKYHLFMYLFFSVIY